MKRFLIYPQQFDTRANFLNLPDKTSPDGGGSLGKRNKTLIIERLQTELGERDFETKLQNFKDLGASPFSILAHHNDLFRQTRYAFFHGYYYPALTGACALGERILNHLILDLRGHFAGSSFDRRVHSRNSIADWTKAIETLNEWQIFQHAEVRPAFEALMDWRHKSLHFNPATVTNMRADALAAIKCLSQIIEKQFGFLESRIIPGTEGAFFLTKAAESDPFIRYYYLNQSPLVTPYYAMRFVEGRTLVFDRATDSGGELTDEAFVQIYNSRALNDIVQTDMPWDKTVLVVGVCEDGIREMHYQILDKVTVSESIVGNP